METMDMTHDDAYVVNLKVLKLKTNVSFVIILKDITNKTDFKK